MDYTLKRDLEKFNHIGYKHFNPYFNIVVDCSNDMLMHITSQPRMSCVYDNSGIPILTLFMAVVLPKVVKLHFRAQGSKYIRLRWIH